MIEAIHGKKLFKDTGNESSGTPLTVASGTPSTSGQRVFITDIAGSSDKAGAVLSVKDGDTVVFQVEIGDGTFNHRFKTPLVGTADQTVKVEIDDGVEKVTANIVGFIA